MAGEETKFYLSEMPQKVWSVHHEYLEDKDFLWRARISSFESAYYAP